MKRPTFALGMACIALAACASLTPTSTSPPAPEAGHTAATPAPTSGAGTTPHPDPGSEPGPVTARVVNPWAEPAREVLVQYCGRCHRSDLDTSLTGALAVYDLTKPIWYANLRPDQYDGILERVHEASAIGPEDVAVLEAFVGCAKGGACPDPP
jgi:hypothetical protein